MVKNPPANVGDTREAGSISGSGRSPEEGNGNSLQYSCLESSVDKGAWRARAQGISKSWTPLSTHAHTHTESIYLITFFLLFSEMFYFWYNLFGFHGGSYGKESACNAGDTHLIPGSGRFPGEMHGNPLQ